MPFEAPFAAFDMEVEYGGRVLVDLPDLSHHMEGTIDTALFLIADTMVEDLAYGRVPKKPWPILTGRSKGLPPYTGSRGGFYVDNADGDGWEIWNRHRLRAVGRTRLCRRPPAEGRRALHSEDVDRQREPVLSDRAGLLDEQ